jgi:ribosomal protein L30E
MSMHPVLSLLGLALRGGNLAVGEEPVEAVARARDARLLILASDAADNTRRRITHFADAGQCIWVRIPFTKAELGQAMGRTSVAMVAVTDVGLAAAVAHKLAELDPVRFDETASRLDLKAQRAAERRQEQLNHEKNVRTGKYKAAKKAAAKEAQREEEKKGTEKKADEKKPSEKKPHKTYKVSSSSKYASRPSKDNRPKPKSDNSRRFANARPVKKGKGSYKKARG